MTFRNNRNIKSIHWFCTAKLKNTNVYCIDLFFRKVVHKIIVLQPYIWSKIVKRGSFPPGCDSLQNIEIALLTVPLVVICESVQDICLLPGF